MLTWGSCTWAYVMYMSFLSIVRSAIGLTWEGTDTAYETHQYSSSWHYLLSIFCFLVFLLLVRKQQQQQVPSTTTRANSKTPAIVPAPIITVSNGRPACTYSHKSWPLSAWCLTTKCCGWHNTHLPVVTGVGRTVTDGDKIVTDGRLVLETLLVEGDTVCDKREQYWQKSNSRRYNALWKRAL